MQKDDKIVVLGSGGLVGSYIVDVLKKDGYTNVTGHNRADCDLLNHVATKDYLADNRFDYVFLAAARVGGIAAKMSRQAEFIYENLMIQSNVIHNCYLSGVKKMLFLSSSSVYPKDSPQPIKEKFLLTGHFDPTSFGYATAKVAGIKMCEAYNQQYKTDFLCVQLTNVYGPRDNFDLQDAHVLPLLVRKFYEACKRGDKEVVVWGTGAPRREFLYVGDLARACMFVMKSDDLALKTLTNIGTWQDVSIMELAYMIKEISGFKGNVVFDETKPDGMLRKSLDVTKINSLGWYAQVGLKEGLEKTYNWYASNPLPL